MSAAVTVREHGLLMSGPLIAPTMDGRRRQTRRLHGLQKVNRDPGWWRFECWTSGASYRDGRRRALFLDPKNGCPIELACPYGQPGDRLWVRETWCGPFQRLRMEKPSVLYRADLREGETYPAVDRWRPPIFMPRWASRITLELTDVRVERVQEISRDDAQAEGVPQTASEALAAGLLDCAPHEWDNCTTVENFARLWDSLNAKRGYGWERNPWVWVLAFRRIES